MTRILIPRPLLQRLMRIIEGRLKEMSVQNVFSAFYQTFLDMYVKRTLATESHWHKGETQTIYEFNVDQPPLFIFVICAE